MAANPVALLGYIYADLDSMFWNRRQSKPTKTGDHGSGKKESVSLNFANETNQVGTSNHHWVDPVTLLVIQSNTPQSQAFNWKDTFKGYKLYDGREISVVQASWDRLMVQSDSPGMSSHTPVLVHVKEDDGSGGCQTIKPDFILVRNEVRGATHLEDWRTSLFGLMFAQIPSVNSLDSIYRFLERPIVQGELNAIQRRLGVDVFPVIPQSYYSSYANMMYGTRFPAVLKIGHAHAGAGKCRVGDHHDWEDMRSIVAMTDGKYCTAEPFINGAFDVRLQKIGDDHYRAYQRVDTSGNWKTNTGCSMIKDIEMNERYKLWIDEASKIFGGLDICTVDIICEEESGKEFILEVNGTSSGLLPDHAKEDNEHIRDYVLKRMHQELVG